MAPETDDRRDRKDFSPAPVITALHTANFVPALLNAVNAVVPPVIDPKLTLPVASRSTAV